LRGLVNWEFFRTFVPIPGFSLPIPSILVTSFEILCTPPAPNIAFVCINGVWTALGNLALPSLTLNSNLNINGDIDVAQLTLTQNAAIVIGGKFHIYTSVT
jgi:hypothetical protein